MPQGEITRKERKEEEGRRGEGRRETGRTPKMEGPQEDPGAQLSTSFLPAMHSVELQIAQGAEGGKLVSRGFSVQGSKILR